jgi:hypothetical protein
LVNNVVGGTVVGALGLLLTVGSLLLSQPLATTAKATTVAAANE